MLLEIILLVLAVPVGFLVAWMARDELVQGRRWFKVLIILGFALGIWFYLTGLKAESLSSFFVAIVSLVSYVKGFDKSFVRK